MHRRRPSCRRRPPGRRSRARARRRADATSAPSRPRLTTTSGPPPRPSAPRPGDAPRPRPPRRRSRRSRSPRPRWGTRGPRRAAGPAGPNPIARPDPSWDRSMSSAPRRGPRPAARRRPDAARTGGTSSRCAGGAPARAGPAGTSSAVTAPIVPRRREDRPIAPVREDDAGAGRRAGSTRTADTSRPRSRIASSMNRPKTSSPTTPTIATRSPSRAAAQAMITELLPIVRWISLTTRSTCPKTGRGSGSETMTSGLTSPTTRMSNARSVAAEVMGISGVSIRRTSRPRAPPVGWAASHLGRHGRPLRSTSSARRRRRAAPSLASHAARSSGGMTAAGAHTDRPTSTPLAPASQAVSTWASNVASSTPPDSRTHGRREAASSSAQASVHSVGSVTVRSYGNSALRTSPPIAVRRRAVSTTTRRRASPVTGSPSSPNESGSTKSARSSRRQAAATSSTSRSWSAALAASGW